MNDKENDKQPKKQSAKDKAQGGGKDNPAPDMVSPDTLTAFHDYVANHLQASDKAYKEIFRQLDAVAEADRRFLGRIGADEPGPGEPKTMDEIRDMILDDIAKSWHDLPPYFLPEMGMEAFRAGFPGRDNEVPITTGELRDILQCVSWIKTMADCAVICEETKGDAWPRKNMIEIFHMVLRAMERIGWIIETRLIIAKDAEGNPGE